QEKQRPVDAATGEQHPAVVAPAAPEATGLNKALLRFIEDDAPPRNDDENPDESRAYDYVVRYAKDVPLASFKDAARTDVTFAQLLGSEANKFRGEVVHVQGRLKRIRDIGPTPALEADGLKHLYEAWIFSEAYRGYSYCCLLTELPTNIPVGEELNEKVSFDGYFYKIYRFRAGDTTRRAPLMIGRSIVLRQDERSPISLAD